ncbi:hypothetical protein K8I85_12050 [bacterium]|nr:hypothetical protein [bacterium]
MPARSRRAVVRQPASGEAPLFAPFFRAALLALFALALAAPAARAQITAIENLDSLEWEEEEYPFLLYGIYGFGSLASVDMLQVNEALSIVNREIALQGSFGVQFDPIERGGGYGGGIQVIIAHRYVFRTDWERLTASTHVGGVTSESRVEVPADVFSTSLGYDMLSSNTLRFGVGFGLAWYNSRAEQIITETLTGQDEVELGRIKLDGSTLGPLYQMFFEAKFTERLFVGVTAGYRTAKVTSLDISGVNDIEDPRSDTAFISIPVAEANPADETSFQLRGGGDSVDWTGFYGRAAMTYYINIPTF